MKMYDLPTMDNRKSFYGKAKVIEKDNGEKVLQFFGIAGGGKSWWDSLEVA